MRNYLFSLFLIVPFFVVSQIPNYYNDINLNLSGASLKKELASKITVSHTVFLNYTPGVWNALKVADLNPADPSEIILIYGFDDNDGSSKTDRTRAVNMNGGNIGDWNREHVYSKSLGQPNLGITGPGADAHHLRPSDVKCNASRSNRMFADGTGNAGIVGRNWYPGDEWKGDVARMMMYMYLRYGDRCLPINVGVGKALSVDSNMIKLFLEWNAEDAVSALEIQRNEVLEGIQGNRNPFIDNPAFATLIWGGVQAEDRFNANALDAEASAVSENLTLSNITTSSLTLTWDNSNDNINVVGYDVYQNNTLIASVTNTTFNVLELKSNTLYSFTVYAKDASGNLSKVGKTQIAKTLVETFKQDEVLELFFSEYIEGTSNNKAIEIANFTGAIVDLEMYSLKRNVNGGTGWGAAYNLSGTIANKDVFVVSHSAAAQSILIVSDVSTRSDALLFNGNDPVGLFKNNVLIDVIGVFSKGSENFAANVTLRRIATVEKPNTNYDISEWKIFTSNTFDGLGTHSLIGSR